MAFLVWALTWIVGPASSYGLYFLEQRYLAALTLAAQLLALLVLWKNGESAASKFEKRAPSTCTLPNGLVISQWAQGETDFLYTEIFESVQSKSSSSGRENNSYISHGLTLEPGATVFDVGANIGMTTLFLAKNHLSGDVVDDPNLEAAESTEEDEEGEEEEDDDVPLGDAAALKQLTCVALKAACARRGISQSGRKADLVARLLAAAPEESDAAARSNAHARRTSSKGDDWVPLSRIFCFEPVPAIHRVLSRNAEMISTRYSGDSSLPAVEAAALTGHVDVVALNVGLSDAPGVTTFDWHPNMSLWSTGDAVFGESRLQRWRTDMPSSIAKKQGDGELPAWLACLPSAIKIWLGNKMLDAISLKVPITAELKTISQIIEENNVTVIDLLKVDVEGLEMQVLKGITSDAHWNMVQQVVMEIEDYELLAAITELLDEQGFDIAVRKGLELEEHGAASSEVTHLWARRL